MYVCLCKALTETEVANRARGCIGEGKYSPDDLLEVMGLPCEEACNFCVSNPEHIVSILEDELELHGYTAPSPDAVEQPMTSA